MNTIQRAGSATVALVAIIMSASPASAVLIIDDAGPTSPAPYGGTFSYVVGGGVATHDTSAAVANTVGGDETYNTVTGDTATWTPGISGNYDIYVHWLKYNSHESAANYTVNSTGGPSSFVFNQRQLGNQNGGGAITGSDLSGSGWVKLGNFNLNGSSNVVLTHNSTSTGPLVADGVRLHSAADGILIDEQVLATSANSWNRATSHIATDPADTSIQYLYNDTSAGASLTYSLGSAGLYSLDVSWGVYSSHVNAAQFVLDLDGNPLTTLDQTTLVVDQTLYADQVTGSNNSLGGQWSGFMNMGTFNLTASSIVILSRVSGSSTTALSADVLRITPVPEPSSLGLAAIAVAMWFGCFRGSRSCNKCR